MFNMDPVDGPLPGRLSDEFAFGVRIGGLMGGFICWNGRRLVMNAEHWIRCLEYWTLIMEIWSLSSVRCTCI